MDQLDDVIGGAVYRRRRRRSPWAVVATALFYLTSLAPAAWIVWHFNLVDRVNRQLNGIPEPHAQAEPHDEASALQVVEPQPPRSPAASPAMLRWK